VHSRYQRHPWDVPWGRWPVQLVVPARRFFCEAPTCLRRIVVEPFPQVLARDARQTERWRQMLLELAHACGAEMGARLVRWLGYVTRPDTLIRRQRQESFVFPAPRILGVDEFARQRGRTYGTRLVDLERRQPIAVLEGRTAEPLIQWLQGHPAIAVLVRDRADAYALAGRVAAPEALQVVHRFPLVRNVSEALKALLHSRRWPQPAPGLQPEPVPPTSGTPSVHPANGPPPTSQPTPRQRAGWEAIQPYRGRGLSLRQIAPVVGLDRRTVRKYLMADQPPGYAVRRPRPTQLTPYLGYLAERWAQGCHHARRLYHELVQRGYRGSESMVRRVVRPWRARPQVHPPAIPPAQQAQLLLQPAGRLTEAHRRTLEKVLQANPLLAQGYQLKTRFQTLLAERDVGAFEPWLHATETSNLPSVRSLARSFRQDAKAILAALTTAWSTGQCEGQICRVNLLKRLGYGRAKLDLLRQRIVHRIPAPLTGPAPGLQVPQPIAA
jgi:transposase